ncbi:MAG: 30S ribosomal protein S6 [Alphaproteobacteria bacterium]|nr:30S ribosomal protein S6 [Alphaproteobacteria bacterium]
MPFYENVFVVRQDVASAQVEQLTETYETLIKDNGGAVTKKEFWGLKGLAYRIRKNRKGHFVLMNIDSPPAAVQELERNMRINEDVLRYITVRVDALEEGPSAMMQKRDERDERGPRGDRPRRGRSFGGFDRDSGPAPQGDAPAIEGDRA